MAEKCSPQTHSHSVINLFLTQYQATLIVVTSAVCVCSGWVSLVLAVLPTRKPVRSSQQRASQRPDQSEHTGVTGRGGRSSNKPFRTESEYTYYTEMLYEKPMWVWKIAQYKSILVYINNWIMISRNGHDMGPLSIINDCLPQIKSNGEIPSAFCQGSPCDANFWDSLHKSV